LPCRGHFSTSVAKNPPIALKLQKIHQVQLKTPKNPSIAVKTAIEVITDVGNQMDKVHQLRLKPQLRYNF